MKNPDEIHRDWYFENSKFYSLFLINNQPEYETGNFVSGSVHLMMYQYVPVGRFLFPAFPSHL